VADIFVSYTSSDWDWASWIAKELEALGHTPHIHEFEVSAGDDIYKWMEECHDAADRVLCVVSDEYLKLRTRPWNATLRSGRRHRSVLGS
jgi:TIR domain